MTQPLLALLASSVRFALTLTVLCGLIYPLGTAGIAGALFPHQATGSVVTVDGRAVGSSLVGQPFAADGYLHPRPSACAYDPRGVAGSNMAASNPDLRGRVRDASAAVVAREGVAPGAVPPELVAASGSGLDPHLTPEAARIQVPRIARARGVEPAVVEQILADATEGAGPWSLGPPRVPVLEVNLALDRLGPADGP